MRRLFLLLSSVILLFVPVACNPEQQAVSELERFVEYLQESSDNLDDQAMEEADQRYAEIVEELDTYAYDEEKGKCAALFAKRSMRDMESDLDEFLDEAGGFVQGLIESFADDSTQLE